MNNLTNKELDALRKLAGALYELHEYASRSERFNQFIANLNVITRSTDELFNQLIDVIDEQENIFTEAKEPIVYVSEAGDEFTRTDIHQIIDESKIAFTLGYNFDPESDEYDIVELVLYRYVIGLCEWKHPTTIISEALDSDEELEVLQGHIDKAIAERSVE
jgi:hypothetical protein